jgi:choline dehydrogenase
MWDPDEVRTDVDLLVVGGGTGGAVVAGRLAERGDRQVLLLEAGPDYGSANSGSWPADLLDAAYLPSSHDWGYRGSGAGGQDLTFGRARVIGGCSAHNGCAQSWGWRGDYDAWAAADLSGWGADDLLPLFEVATERMRIRRWEQEEVQPFHRCFVTAMVANGVPRRADQDSLDGGCGVDVWPANSAEGVRFNTAFAYLDPVRNSRSLQIVGDTLVDRLVVRDGKIRGVEAVTDGHRRVYAAGTVVVCAGTYGTPEILLRSGIGPAAELEAIGVGVVADLPGVGANLHDQPTVELRYEGTADLAADLAAFTATRACPQEQAIAKLRSSVADGPYDLHIYPWVEPDPAAESGWQCVIPVGLLAPRSRGRLRLGGIGYQTRAVLDHGFLAEQHDVTALADGVRQILPLIRGGEMSRYLGRTRQAPPASDEALQRWIRSTHSHYWHPAGTCRMGRPEDGAVTNENGAVYEVQGLYVADASLFPTVPRGTPALPVVVAAERIATTLP